MVVQIIFELIITPSTKLPEPKQSLEEDYVPLSAKSVQGEVEDQDCGRLSNGAEEKVQKYISRKLGGIQRKTAMEIMYDEMTTVYNSSCGHSCHTCNSPG